MTTIEGYGAALVLSLHLKNIIYIGLHKKQPQAVWTAYGCEKSDMISLSS